MAIAEALDFLSPQVHHHNVCPSSILVTKTGTWKLSGLEFIGLTIELGIHLDLTSFVVEVNNQSILFN
ncbi:SCY1-like protein 2 [Aphis craccivora]|uniref:SCY1-like protein 2 n=1 Tax=Aphis craccivora TaxID=307492 RepID=A0A6G0ZJR4_APHCR|nr:SCY1-like protein 2 [Aphis craccivora]